jgi:hypothetical protein
MAIATAGIETLSDASQRSYPSPFNIAPLHRRSSSWFADQQELFSCIREHDTKEATDELERLSARTPDPVQRALKLFLGTADCWLDHMDQFLVLFPAPTFVPAPVSNDTVPFGRSPVVQRMSSSCFLLISKMIQPHERRAAGTAWPEKPREPNA